VLRCVTPAPRPGARLDAVRLTGGEASPPELLLGQAKETGRPVVWNMPLPGGESKTVAVAPPGWTQEGLEGYVAGIHRSLSDSFGLARVEPLLNWRERCRRDRGR
jgi:hypothetical protein